VSRSIEFASPAVVKVALDARVRAFTGSRRMTDSVEMYVKGISLIVAAVLSWSVLIFRDNSTLVDIAAIAGLALSLVGIGFNVQHDGNHGGFSRLKWVNAGAGFTLDILGASSFFWKLKHNVNHHTYTNIPDEDGDINLGWLARLSDDARWFWFHRYQHIYLWFLYTFVHLKYTGSDAWRLMVGRRVGQVVRKPSARDLAGILAGKAIFFTLAFGIPLMFHSWGSVLAGFLATSMSMGVIFSIVFQLAHTVDVVEHPSQRTGSKHEEWVVHQIRTTANFATRSRFLRVALGGLNFQREHHLFPKISHVHYPALANIVKEVCAEHQIEYCEHTTMMQALRSHYRFVKSMGMKPVPQFSAAQ
jgi:linoleoyl-CoA desaturase